MKLKQVQVLFAALSLLAMALSGCTNSEAGAAEPKMGTEASQPAPEGENAKVPQNQRGISERG
jgi:predicted small secreted protein